MLSFADDVAGDRTKIDLGVFGGIQGGRESKFLHWYWRQALRWVLHGRQRNFYKGNPNTLGQHTRCRGGSFEVCCGFLLANIIIMGLHLLYYLGFYLPPLLVSFWSSVVGVFLVASKAYG